MIRAIPFGAEGARIEITFDRVSGKLCSPRSKWVPGTLQSWGGLGCEGREDGHQFSLSLRPTGYGTYLYRFKNELIKEPLVSGVTRGCDEWAKI